MNFRLTAILLGAILIGGIALLIYSFSGEGDAVSTDALMEELASVKPDDIDLVEIEREDGAKLKLVRAGKDRWNVEWDVLTSTGTKEPIKAKADPAAVNDLIASLMKAKPTAHSELSNNPALDGLQPPGLKVTFRQGSEKSSTINFGDVLSGGKAVAFVTTSARPSRPLATPRSSVESLFRVTTRGKAVDIAKWGSDYRVKGVFGDTTSTDLVSAATLAAKGKTLGLTRSGSGWVFTQPAGWGAADALGDTRNLVPNSFTGVNQLLGTLTNLQASSAADFIEKPTPQQLKDYGLDGSNPDAVRVEIINKDNEKQVAVIGKKESAAAVTLPGSPTPPSNKVWVRIDGQPGVVRATAGDLGGLLPIIENPDPLRDRTLLAYEKPRIDGIDISGGVKLRKTGMPPSWKLYGPPSSDDPQTTNLQLVSKLLDAITERRTIKGFTAPNDANFAPNVVQVELRVWEDGFDPPPADKPKAEPKQKEKVQPITLIFGKSEGDSVHVRRILPDGAKADFILPDKIKIGVSPDPVELVSAVRKTRLDLLDANLKTFSPEIVSKVTVAGTASYELVKEDRKDFSTGGDRWTFAAPADRKGQTADTGTIEEMLRILGTTQSVTRFVNEAPDEKARIEYGFDAPKDAAKGAPPAPRLKVTIGLKDAIDKERVYEFGNPTPSDASYVYARQAGRTAVFTVPRLVHDKFASPDLRDRAIFRFDVAQVTKVEFKGWGKTGFVVELKVEKNKDGNWVATLPDKFALDPAKVNAFLATLSKTPVKSFVAGEPVSEHGFGNDKEFLQIILTMASGPGISLNFGAATPDGLAYYGWSSNLPEKGRVFTIDSAPLKVYKESSGAFAR